MKTECDVLVVGAGPAGLALAVELASRGRTVQVVEKSDRLGRSPRAKTTNVRSMEHMRRWGLAEKIRDASPLAADHPNRIVFATGLYGREITAFDNAFFADRARHDDFSESAQWIPQSNVEATLRDHAAGLPGCDIAMATELTGFTEDEDGVTAQVVGGGGNITIRARYLVGADGANSTVRKILGIAMEGVGRIGAFLTVIFRAPGLAAKKHISDGLMFWLVNKVSPCILGPMDRDDVWFLGTQLPPDAPLDKPANTGRVARALGPEAPFEILATDVWTALQLQAASYGTERIFLIGDACHLHPPFGGYGMNLGIADSVDLGWKIDAVLSGWGDPSLLESYEAERRPVHKRVIDESVENMGTLVQHFFNPDIEADGPAGENARAAAAKAVQDSKDREFHSLGMVIGYDYAGSPIVIPDGTDMPPRTVADYTPSAWPGRRAPHAWLADGSSLFDHFGTGFTLLRLDGKADVAPLLQAATAAGVPMSLCDLPDAGLASLFGAPLALIRPDQHVGWRGRTAKDAPRIVETVRGAG